MGKQAKISSSRTAPKDHGALTETLTAAYRVLSAVDAFDFYGHRPAGRAYRTHEYLKRFADKLAKVAVELLAALRQLDPLLARPDVWVKLCNANQFPASLGDGHGPCFPEVALRLGCDRYCRLMEWVGFASSALSLADFPKVSATEIYAGISGRQGHEEDYREAFSLLLAREQLEKEFLRATGVLAPGSATASSSRRPGRPIENGIIYRSIRKENLTNSQIRTRFSVTPENARQLKSRAKRSKAVTE